MTVLHDVTLLEAPSRSTKAFIGFVTGRSLADFASDERDGKRTVIEKLFESNVRGFLKGEKYIKNPGADGLASTLRDQRCSEVLLLHNGVVIVARACTMLPDCDAIDLVEPQIVNGCQTVCTLIENFDLIGDARVAVKIVATSDDRLLDRIVVSTNTQAALQEYDFLSRNMGLRRIVKELGSAEVKPQQQVWIKTRLGQAIAWPGHWRGDTDWQRVITPRHLLEAYVAAITASPHDAHHRRGRALDKVAQGQIFSPDHDPWLYLALSWLVVAGRRFARRHGLEWHDLFSRAGLRAYPARHHFIFALWRLVDRAPDENSAPALGGSDWSRKRFRHVVEVLSLDDGTLGDAAANFVRSAAAHRRLESTLLTRADFTRQLKTIVDTARAVAPAIRS